VAKQKISLTGIVFVVGLMVLILCTGAGFFKNFAIQTNLLQVNIPSVAAATPPNVLPVGVEIGVVYTITNNANNDTTYAISGYLDGNYVSTITVTGNLGSYPVTFSTPGTHSFYLHIQDTADSIVNADSNTMQAYIGVQDPSATPTPTPIPTPTSYNPYPTPTATGGPILSNNIVQQILSWLQQIWNIIYNFVRSMGL
jgi:hypothetical protein